MKPLKLLSVVILFLISYTLKAQLSVQINIGTAPQWGPVGFTDVRYYYLPAVEAYYDIQTSMFIYSSGGIWIHQYNLPSQYRNYDLYNGYKVVVNDYRGETPNIYFQEHKTKYHRDYSGVHQRTIGEKPGGRKNQSKTPNANKSHKHGGNGKGD